MNKHTPEPWAVVPEKPTIVIMPEPCEIGNGHKYVACGGGNNEENARRIVACVNACAGMTTEGLETFNVAKEMRELAEEWEQYRTKLAEAIEALEYYADDKNYFPRSLLLLAQEKNIRLAPIYGELGEYAKKALLRIKGDNCGSM